MILTEEFFAIEGLIVLLLFIATAVGIVTHRWRKPYPIGLVIVGLLLAPLERSLFGRVEIAIGPEIILGLLVPPLIFEAAFHLNLDTLQDNWKTILMFAVPGVALTTVIVGGLVSLTGLALPVALVFGALVAATDPVAVIALFKTMGVPKHLQTLLEGESLFNDGTAIVVFNLVLAVVLGNGGFEWARGLAEFFIVAGGGLLAGGVLALLISLLISRINQPMIIATLTTILAYGAYALAELLGLSGVLAVVAAGIVGGTIGQQRMSPTSNIAVTNLWEFAAFVANSFVFLVIGLEIELSTLTQNIPAIGWALLSVLLARAVVVYGLGWVDRIPGSWKKVLYWGGLRGAISLALLLSLPPLAGREQVQAMTFGVVLFTLLVQGTTMPRLVRHENLDRRKSEALEEYERRHARAVAARAAVDHLERMNKQGLLSEYTWNTVAPLLRQRFRALSESVGELIGEVPDIQSEELDTAWKERLRAERAALTDLMTDGVISEETFTQLVAEVDLKLAKAESGWTELVRVEGANGEEVCNLIAAVIQKNDIDAAIEALTSLGLPVTRLPSAGGFLGSQNATLLIGASGPQVKTAIRALESSCIHRMQYFEARESPLPLPGASRVRVGGATLFIFEAERYEEF